MRLARMELASSEMKPISRVNYNQDTLTRHGTLVDKPFYPRQPQTLQTQSRKAARMGIQRNNLVNA